MMGRLGLNDDSNVCDEFVDYAVLHHRADLERMLEAEDVNAHYSILVNFVTLFETSTSFGDGILSHPIAFLPICDRALIDAQKKVKEELKSFSLVVKVNVHARIVALPVCPELYKSVFPRNEDLGSFLRISGTVVRRTMPKMLEYKKTYLCNKCKYNFTLFADYEKHYAIPQVGCCRNPEACKNKNVVSVSSSDDFKDYQELKIQEQVGKLDMGSIPKSMLVTVEDDLVDACKPGDDVVICGTVRRRWKTLMNGSRPEVDLVLQANSLEVSNAQNNASSVTQEMTEEFKEFWKTHSNRPMIGRNFILQCVCPEVYGLYLIKLAIALVLSGGVPQHPGTGARVRGESHLLLVGDPGTAKSQLLRFAAAVSPRSVFTTGIGSTSAGLTVSAAMGTGGEWQLEAGALVLADGGICCIDEFNSIRESERASIHEAMEQQTLSVAKAGMVCKLSTVCSILAATNPKGQFDTAHPITVNCAIASPLLSRFDLVFVLLDRKNKDWDSLISTYIIQEKTLFKSSSSELWNTEKLQAYFSIVKSLQPRLSEDASLILREYYRVQRRNELSNASRITVRLLESLVRLAQAHAKFMFSREVTVRDAVVSVSLMEASHQASSIDAFMSNPIQTTFPVDPEEEYIDMAQKILGGLGLQDLLQIEIDKYMKGHSSKSDENVPSSPRGPDINGGPSQLAATKSDLNKKLDVVFNNIRQNKLREENKALAFQQKAGRKRKKRADRSAKRNSVKKPEDAVSGSDGSSDELNSPAKTTKVAKTEKQRPVFGLSDSESDLSDVSPVKSTQKTIVKKAKLHSKDKVDVGYSNDVQDVLISDAEVDFTTKCSTQKNLVAEDDVEDCDFAVVNAPKATKNKSGKRRKKPSIGESDCEIPEDVKSTKNPQLDVESKRNTIAVETNSINTSQNSSQPKNISSSSNNTSKSNSEGLTKIKSISSKTMNKLKAFTFKEQSPSNNFNTSNSSADLGQSSEDILDTIRQVPSTENLNDTKTLVSSTQRSIFSIDNNSEESDYEL